VFQPKVQSIGQFILYKDIHEQLCAAPRVRPDVAQCKVDTLYRLLASYPGYEDAIARTAKALMPESGMLVSEVSAL
jgi:hypothetical protein